MFFSSLELIGFKSFKREKFTFDMPISIFTGPNGCGKTNILDSIRWVLGEQNPYSLRAKSMPDLIFHGGEREKPMSMAEVSLSFNNNNNILPLEFEEIKITRRVFPQSESVYMFNGKPTRLKDITSLLLDTGLSQDGYFLMNQEKIGLILKSNEERLRLFEEASAIAGYRVKKEEASGNLRKTFENITRIGDIMAEAQKQADSLKYQASKARRYKRLKDEFNVYKYHTLQEEYNRKKEELGNLEDEDKRIRIEIKKFEKINKEKRAYFEERLKGLKESNDKLFEIRKVKEKMRDEIVRHEERLIFLLDVIFSLKEKEKILIIKEKNLKDEALAMTSERKGLLTSLEEQKDFEDANLLEIKEKIQKLQKEEEGIKDEFIDRLRSKAGLKGRLQEREREISHLKNRIIRLKEEKERLDKEKCGIVLKRELCQKEMENLLVKIKKERNALDGLKVKEHDILKEEGNINKMITEIMEEENLFKNKLSSISSLPLYREVIERLIKDGVVKEDCILEKMIETSDEYIKAIEGFLGERLSGVVADEEKVEDLICNINKLNLGRVFIIVRSQESGVRSQEEEIGSQESGVRRRRSEVGDKYGVLANSVVKVKDDGLNWLFSNLLIVKDIATALRLSKEGWKTITINGIRVEDGLIEAGDEMGLLSKKRKIAFFKKKLLKLRESIKDFKEKGEEKEREKRVIIKEREEAERLLLKDEDSFKRLSIEAGREEEGENALSSKVLRIEDEIEDFETRGRELQKEIQAFVNEELQEIEGLRIMEKRLLGLKIEIKGLVDEERKLEDQERNRYNALELQKEKLNLLLERQKKEESQIKGILLESQAIIKERKEKEMEQIILKERLLEDKKRSEGILNEEMKLAKAVESFSIMEREKNMQLLEEKINNLYKKERENKEKMKEAEISISLLNERIGTIVSEYGEKIKNMEGSLTKEKAQNLERELLRYHEVNLSSISEYDKIQERLNFYKNELLDLNKAKDDLWYLINELDKDAKEIFDSAFKKIKDNFANIFLKVFEGGSCDILMNNGKIDIEVELPGKKKKGLLLLSSGEKTLLAIILLFSLFMVKPAPFCFLDEIDASLDEANIKRFVSLISLFSKDTQFLIITHNKRTIEIGDTIYGITMEVPGVSRSLSMRLKNNLHSS